MVLLDTQDSLLTATNRITIWDFLWLSPDGLKPTKVLDLTFVVGRSMLSRVVRGAMIAGIS